MKLGRWFGAFVCLLAIGSAQTTPVQVKAKLVDGTGNVYRQGFLHFELQNCGSNFPLASGGTAIAKSAFDLKPNQTNGSIVGQALGYDQIFCGGIASTQYDVTVMKDANTPVSPSKHYLLCSESAPSNSQCSNQIAGLFDLSTAQPMDQPVQPGHVQLFGNPTKDQLWNQPTGTKATFVGTFDFSQANLIGISGGGGGGGITSLTGTLPISVTAGSQPVISIAKADSSHDGYLSATDWGLFNGKASGTVTSVGITVPQGLAISGCPITGAGTCAISLNGQFPVSSLGTGSPSSLNWLNGSGAWTSPLTFGGQPVTSLVAGTNASLVLSSNALTISSTSAVTYPILAPDGTPPQIAFSTHPEIGLNTTLSRAAYQITQVVVSGSPGVQTVTLTLQTPIKNLSWTDGDTFQIKNLTATNNLNTLNFTTCACNFSVGVAGVSGGTPTSTVAFSAATAITPGTYAVTAGSASIFDGYFQGHSWQFSRLDSSTSNIALHGSVRAARLDAWCSRSGAVDNTGMDVCLLRGSGQISATNAIGSGDIRASGVNNAGASSITVSKGAGVSWSAVGTGLTPDKLLIATGNGDAELQLYTITADTTVTQGTTTSIPITPNLRTNIPAGSLISTGRIRTQLGDATGVEILGDIYLPDAVSWPAGCLTIASTGLIASTGVACGGSASAAGANKDIQFSSGAGVFAVDTGLFTYDTATSTLKIKNVTISGAAGNANETVYTNGATTCAAPGASKSAFCFDTDGFFKISENNGAFFRPGVGAGSGNVVIQGSPSAGQTAEWSDGTHIAGIAVTGTNNYVKSTSPTIVTPKLDIIQDVNAKASITIAATVNAVDGITVTNAATANPATVTVSATGSDSNINLNLVSKGTGVVQCNGVTCGGGGSSYTNLFQTDANTLTQRNATVTQVSQVMDSYTDATNYQGLAVGGNYVKTVKSGTGNSQALQLGVHGSAFRGVQITTGNDFVPFNPATAPNVGLASNRFGGFFGASLDTTGAVTVTVANEAVTGTTVNKLAKLTGSPSTAIIAGTADVFGTAGVVTSGAGITGSAALAYSGVASCVFDSATTAGHYVTPSTTVAGDCHDSGIAPPAGPPSSGQVVGFVQSTNVSAGTYSLILRFYAAGSGTGSGTVTTLSTSGGAPLFSSVVNNPTTTPQIVFSVSNAAANTLYANATGSSAAPSFVQPLLTSSLFSNQGTTVQVLHGNAAGNLSFGALNLATEVTGNIPLNNICSGTGAGATTVLFGDCTWRVPAGAGNVNTNGTITVNQAAEWATTTSLRSVAVTGSGSYVKNNAPVISNPIIGSIKDTSGNRGLDIVPTTSAVDSVTIANAAAGGTPQVSVDGADANIDILLSGKGLGKVRTTGPVYASGTVMMHFGPEGNDPGLCTSGTDGFYANSAIGAHYLTMCNNGGAQQKIIGSSADISTSDFVVGLHLPATRAGDIAYYNGIGWQTVAGNNSGSRFLIENATGVPSWSAGTAAVAWSAFQDPVSSLTLSMGSSNQTTFNFSAALTDAFIWANTTAATSIASPSSPTLALVSSYWHGSSLPDEWRFTSVVSNGTDAASTLTLAHVGTPGLALVSAPGWKSTTASAFVGAEVSCASITAAASAIDVFCPDSTMHGWKMSNNNGTTVPVVGGPSGGSTSGDVAVFSGTTGGLLQDTGITAAQVVTSTSTFVNGEVVVASGSGRATASAGIQSSTLVTAASVIADANVVQGSGGVRGVSDTGIATANLVTATANYTVGHLVSAAANNKTTTDSGLLASDVLSNASSFTTHGVAVGSGAKTLTSTAVGSTGIPLIGQTAADPIFGTASIAGGGTGATTAANAAIALLPVATRTGDVLYWDGSIWNHLAGNNSGTNFLQENSSGVPSWAAGSSAVALSAVTAAAGANTLANGDNAQVWNWALTTAGKSAFTFGETTAATSTGTPYLVNIQTLATSTANPLIVTAVGTSNGIRVLKSGFLSKIGTGGIDSNMLYCDVTDGTKCAQFTLSGITTATTRAVTIPDAASTTVVADTGASNNFLTAISASGVISKAQPAVANLSDGANVVTAASAAGAANQVVLSNAADKTLKYATVSGTATQAFFATAGPGAPAFRAIATGDLPVALANQTSINGLAITASTGTLAIANAKTFTASNTMTQTATDGSTVAFGAGGTVQYVVASGTSALGTSAISSATCATVVTTSATGALTTDNLTADFNADPTSTTGYSASASGMLSIIKYLTANNANFKVCNNTSGSITPGAVTLQWRVIR